MIGNSSSDSCGEEHMDEDDPSSSDLAIDPLTLDDIRRRHESCGSPESGDYSRHPQATAAVGKERKKPITQVNANRLHWQWAIMKIRSMVDPWEKFHLDDHPTEIAIRYRYNTIHKTWVKDEVQVKMEPQAFNHGAMRECYRMRKLTKTCHTTKWKTAANYVAKCYMDKVDRSVYFEDVKLQMDAKLWGEEFNRHNPPKKVDIFQMSILEFTQREGNPLFHVEHFIEGHYIKYNSNSGFVCDEAQRLTPQAFSHFTFERSGHEMIVVDIQGVGDLYTDPQIHTSSGTEYGDGNLGTRGMALFFHSHECNSICESLGLSKFDLSTSEVQERKLTKMHLEGNATQVRGTEEVCVLPSEYEKLHLHEFLRSRSHSSGSVSFDDSTPPHSPVRTRTYSSTSQGSDDTEMHSDNDSGLGIEFRRIRRNTDSGSLTEENERQMFSNLMAKRSRPSNVQHEIELRKMRENITKRTGGSVLGQIHLDLAKYHELCRFKEPGTTLYDKDAALFHLQHAANCDNLEAVVNLARIYLCLPHDILVDIELPATEDNVTKGMDYIQIAAEAGDKAAMIFIAKSYDTGHNLGLGRKRSWREAVYWYGQAAVMEDADENGHYDGCMDDPDYVLLARQAEMYKDGGYDLPQNLQRAGDLFQLAADAAMAAMKGRLANKYYALAEEVWSGLED